MILSKIMRSLYLKIYVSIVASNVRTYVSVHILKGSKVQDAHMQIFEGEELSHRMISYIHSFISETPFYYISFLDYSSHQGAIPTCNMDQFLELNKEDAFKSLCYNEWSSYTSKVDLNKLEKKYASLGLDFIFSPFSVLENFFKDKIEMQATLYVLIQDESIAISVFEHSKLKYAQFVSIQNENAEGDLIIAEDKDDLSFDDDQISVNLEDIDVDDGFGDMDDFTDIQDLDSMDEFEDFTEISVGKSRVENENSIKHDESKDAGFNEEYKRFSAIKNALKVYYTDEKYENNFIESIYIAAACELHSSLKNYLEEELFLKVYIRQVEISSEVFDLAKREAI